MFRWLEVPNRQSHARWFRHQLGSLCRALVALSQPGEAYAGYMESTFER